MTQARVFQADESAVRARGGSAFDGEAVWPDEYRLVARVEVHDGVSPQNAAEEAFHRTQHIEEAWWKNEGVERVGPETRSTSVGDVVVVGEVGFLCDRCGWQEFPVARPALSDGLFG
jgi:hypothetical protein